MFDVAVIGAGPAGLMAAATAAEKGLKVVLIEKFKDISKVNRACCQQFVMDEDYEKENIRVADGKIVFPHNGFEVMYDGPTHDITDTCFISPRGHTVRFAYRDRHAIAIKFDKGRLLQSLLERCIQGGVDYRSSMPAYRAVDLGDCVEVQARHNGTSLTLKARKLIAADGVNSRMAEMLGLNRGRSHIATALCLIYTLEGVQDFDPRVMKWHMGRAYFSYAPVIIDPPLRGDGVAELVVMGNARQRPDRIFADFTTRGPTAHLYKDARVTSRTGCTVKAYSSMMVPCLGNALAIGDSAAYVEVEVQGALMCGFHAGRAAVRELAGEDGFERYVRWWQQTFEFNSEEALRVAQGYALVPTYADDEIDYLFSLIEDRVLDGAYGQYRAPRLVWDAIMEHRERIRRDNPGLFEKIYGNTEMTLGDTFK